MIKETAKQLVKESEHRVISDLNGICQQYVEGKITAENAIAMMALGHESGYIYLNCFVKNGVKN